MVASVCDLSQTKTKTKTMTIQWNCLLFVRFECLYGKLAIIVASVTFFNRKSAKITQPCASHSFSIFFVIRFHFIEKSKYLYETYGVGAFQPIWIMWQAKLKFTENSVLCSVSVHHSLVKRDFICCYKLYGNIIVRVCISRIRTAQRHS